MKNAFSKEDREFQEMLMRNAAKQDLYGGAGNELAQDIVEDIIGMRKDISSVATIVKTDANGMPYVYRERMGKVLDCGHRAYSLHLIYAKYIVYPIISIRYKFLRMP